MARCTQVKPDEQRFAFTQSIVVDLSARLREARVVALPRGAALGACMAWLAGFLLAVSLCEAGMAANDLRRPASVASAGQALSLALGGVLVCHALTVPRRPLT